MERACAHRTEELIRHENCGKTRSRRSSGWGKRSTQPALAVLRKFAREVITNIPDRCYEPRQLPPRRGRGTCKVAAGIPLLGKEGLGEVITLSSPFIRGTADVSPHIFDPCQGLGRSTIKRGARDWTEAGGRA